MRKFLFALLLVIAACYQGFAQEVFQEEDCAVTLSSAENDFAAGRFYGIPGLLKSCIDRTQFSNEEQLRVYMLLAQVYMLTDDPASAEESYLKLLAANPEYVATEDGDPIDVVYLSKKFTTTPIFTPHLKVGMNVTSPYVIYDITTNSQSDQSKQTHKALPGFNAGAGIEWNVNNSFGIGGELIATFKSFEETDNFIWGADKRTTTEKQWWVDIPIYLRYGAQSGRLRPYGYAGYAVNLLVHDKQQIVSYDGTEGGGSKSTEGPDLNALYKRHILNGSVVLGGGVKYKFGKNFFLLDLRLMAGLTDITKEDRNPYAGKNSWDLGTDVTRYGSIDNIMRINNLSLSLGFVRPLYEPRRLDHARTKGVSRKISRE